VLSIIVALLAISLKCVKVDEMLLWRAYSEFQFLSSALLDISIKTCYNIMDQFSARVNYELNALNVSDISYYASY